MIGHWIVSYESSDSQLEGDIFVRVPDYGLSGLGQEFENSLFTVIFWIEIYSIFKMQKFQSYEYEHIYCMECGKRMLLHSLGRHNDVYHPELKGLDDRALVGEKERIHIFLKRTVHFHFTFRKKEVIAIFQ